MFCGLFPNESLRRAAAAASCCGILCANHNLHLSSLKNLFFAVISASKFAIATAKRTKVSPRQQQWQHNRNRKRNRRNSCKTFENILKNCFKLSTHTSGRCQISATQFPPYVSVSASVADSVSVCFIFHCTAACA